MYHSRYFRVTALVVFIIIVLGFFAAMLFSRHIDKSQRADLLKEAQQAALLVSPEVVTKLSATPLDLENPSYQKLKEDLTAFRSFNPAIRFVYLLGYHSEIKTQFFFVDSEPAGSLDYSPPGQLFADTREKDITNYLRGQPYTDGPYQDSWGQWFSAYAPIKTTSGEMVALLGIDTATSVWHEQVRFVRVVISLITLLLCMLAAIFIGFVQKKESSITLLEREKQSLLRGEKKLKEVQAMAQVGRISIFFPDETFSFDEKFASFFNAKEDEKISKKNVLSFIHPDDEAKLRAMIDEIISTDIAYTWVDVRLGSKEGGYRLCHIYGNIARTDLLAPNRFSGIIQDITDISHS